MTTPDNTDQPRRISIIHPSRCLVAATGEFGERTFYLQACQDDVVTSVEVQREHLENIATNIDHLLDTLRSVAAEPHMIGTKIDEVSPPPPPVVPFKSLFAVETIALSWNDSRDSVVITFFPGQGSDDILDPAVDYLISQGLVQNFSLPSEENWQPSLELTVAPHQCRYLAGIIRAVLRAGREICPQCSSPINPAGHLCPRANGYRPGQFAIPLPLSLSDDGDEGDPSGEADIDES